MEVAAEKTTDIGSDCVLIAFDKTSTIFDFPRAVYDRFIEFEKSCLPVRFVAVHSCCPNVYNEYHEAGDVSTFGSASSRTNNRAQCPGKCNP